MEGRTNIFTSCAGSLENYTKPVKDMLLLPILYYTKRDARISAEIEVEAEKGGSAIHRTEAMIASVAMNHRVNLYTFDMRHFKPLEDLVLRLFPVK
jgi:predicted nucleic acid-binding protein